MSTAFFLLSCLIVGVMIMRIIQSDSVIIGTLYAQGYRRRELTWHYMAIPVLLSAAGGLAGILLADFVEGVLFDSFVTIAVALILGGIVMLVVERVRPEGIVRDAGQVPIGRAVG